MGMENEYSFGETFVHLAQIMCHLKLLKIYSFVNYVTLSETFV